MYRELVIRAYGDEAIGKIDQLRRSGINITELVLSAVMLADIEKLREKKEKISFGLNSVFNLTICFIVVVNRYYIDFF